MGKIGGEFVREKVGKIYSLVYALPGEEGWETRYVCLPSLPGRVPGLASETEFMPDFGRWFGRAEEFGVDYAHRLGNAPSDRIEIGAGEYVKLVGAFKDGANFETESLIVPAWMIPGKRGVQQGCQPSLGVGRAVEAVKGDFPNVEGGHGLVAVSPRGEGHLTIAGSRRVDLLSLLLPGRFPNSEIEIKFHNGGYSDREIAELAGRISDVYSGLF